MGLQCAGEFGGQLRQPGQSRSDRRHSRGDAGPPRKRGVQAGGCGALGNLADNDDNDDNTVKVAAEGGIGAILGAMRGHPESEEVQAEGCEALWILVVNADNEVEVAAEGGIGATCNALLQSMKSAGAEDAVKRAMALKNAHTVSIKEHGQRLLDALKKI